MDEFLNNTQKLFTVVVCTYNGEKTLPCVLESVLRQKDFSRLVDKVIVVDNASKDGTKSIILSFCERNDRVLYSYEPRQGLSYARLNGALQCATPWLTYIDDDNELALNWLEEAEKYIASASSDMGIFNGAVVPATENISESEQVLLELGYLSLACTHLSESDIDFSETKSPHKEVFGAGMTVRSSVLRQLAESGWNISVGRCGESLGSGEDGDIINYCHSKGFVSGYAPKCLIYHHLPQKRLQLDYIVHLKHGIIKAIYHTKSNQSFYVLRRFRTFFSQIFCILKYKFRKCGTLKEKYQREISLNCARYWIKLIWSDKFFFKKKQ